MQKWEYATEVFQFGESYKHAKEIGGEMEQQWGDNGWELVAVLPHGKNSILAFFKKPA